MLVDPQFLFRIEREPAVRPPGGVYRVSDVELASRLSFLLWSSKDRSVLDSVSQTLADLQRSLGQRDRAKLGEYLEAVREVERRIQKAEAQSERELPVLERPAGSISASFEEYANVMLDLQLLAYQSDLTRVSTFMIAKELSSRTYPEVGVPIRIIRCRITRTIPRSWRSSPR